jgi:U3 small nucleolar RNA-associated protein 22
LTYTDASQIWLAQKNLRFGTSGLGGHNIKIIVAYLFQSRRIGQQTTVLGAFQMVLSFLTDTNFSSIDLYFSGSNKQHSEEKWPAKLYHPVGKDVDGVQFNSLWRVSFSALQDLQNEAKIALGLLQLESDAVFHRIFLEDRNCLSRYDLIFHVPLNALSSTISSQLSNSNLLTESDEANPETEMEDMTIAHFACSKALTIAKRALSNRVKLVSASLRDRDAACSVNLGLSSTVTSWDRHTQPINTLKSLVVTIGIVLDTENAHRRVDKCARHSDQDSLAVEEAAAAEEFRNFWGRKSELRRFKDGAIVDAVVWGEQDIHANSDIVKAASDIQSATLREVTGESIVEAIIRYSLGMHMSSCAGPKGELLDCLGGSLEFALPGSNYVKDELSNGVNTTIQKVLDSTPKQRYLQVVEALDKLRSILTSDIKDLPLVFESITGSHPALRYTSTLPPMPHPMLLKDTLKDYSGVTLSLVAQPLEIIGQVEGGGKWPSEAKVARKLKTAVLLRTSHLLRTQFEVSVYCSHTRVENSLLLKPFEPHNPLSS